MKLFEYLKKHTIVSIGNPVCDRCLIVEMIPDNMKQVVKTILENGCYISEIHWWDRALISSGSSIGYGGPADPRDPEKYFFAETDIFASFEITTSIFDYYEYLDKVKTEYSDYDIYPAFDVCIK